MFRLLLKIPENVCIAVSGGADSMAVLDFLRRAHNVKIFHFDHGTEHGAIAHRFVEDYANFIDVPFIFGSIRGPIPRGVSKEKYWRDERYNFFSREIKDNVLVLAHNLDDAVETWVFSSLHGKPKTIPSMRGNIVRPFLLVKKAALRNWCIRKDVPFLDDPSNEDLKHPRARLRNVIIPEMLKINPGLHKVVAKKYQK